MTDDKPMKVEIVEGDEGMIVYIDDVRVAGEKPSSGGHPIIYSFKAERLPENLKRIKKLEAALREIAYARPECCCISDAMQDIARAALERKKDER